MTVLLLTWLVVATLFTGVALSRLLKAAAQARTVHPERSRGADDLSAAHLHGRPSTPLGMNGGSLDSARDERGAHSGMNGGSGRDERDVVMFRPVDAATPTELENLAVAVDGVTSIVLAPFRPRLGDGVRWLPSDPLLHNRKLGHLQYALAALPASPGKPVLVVDADVRVDAALVDALLAALEAGADLAWAAPHPEERGLSRGLLVQSLHSFETLDVLSGGEKPVCGKAIALSPRALEVLRTLPDCLGEDLELSRRLHAKQLVVALAGKARVPGASSPLLTVVARITRWMQVLKAHRPLLFPTVPLLFAATPVLLVAAALVDSTPLRVGVLGLVAARATLAAVLERRPGLFGAWLGAELLLLWCWLSALAQGSRVTWRGRVLQVGLQGRLGRAGLAP